MTPTEFRQQCRQGLHTSQTSGFCPGFAQANLVILPTKVAADFHQLCLRNPIPCPLLAHTEIGNQHSTNDKRIISDKYFDITRDFPRYTVYENGSLVRCPTDVSDIWDPTRHVGFLIGCSFSFEKALDEAGLPPRNYSQKRNVSMYKTTRRLQDSGVFVDVPYVVSMRPYKLKDISRVKEITGRFKKTHGAPIDFGYDAMERLGIRDLSNPDFGDSTQIEDDEVPVFWGCGVTAQIAALSVHDRIDGPIIGHAPGHMLVTDLRDEDVMEL
ncbi:DUF1445-domain-containing protein [Metschnikowia bicuspidata var. bicuspidata NRRL YB-4993]|uniref:DUF1445-domain-containing protein n=1 Tax=Metschnikowia bicuspidata var. bicuspidata NRRL YB-4993 TaxID=869754 RepID=A0A1A0HGT0_9ASCO|nr:DUF1445-domain-containing protein [Metschnikowia bicuspidata var. bicuspidata NRRL YB-4993]OBA23087.1 DUF1445-domain-containing protein [Metschnikowia bicuspidata var. bicuspidata NRRL YB-4993]